MFKRPPLQIFCHGLNPELVADIADQMAIHFETVNAFDDVIFAEKPRDGGHYAEAWRIIDRFNLKFR